MDYRQHNFVCIILQSYIFLVFHLGNHMDFTLQDTQLEERIYRTDSDCVLAGRPLTEFDLYASTVVNMESAGIRYSKLLYYTVYGWVSIM